jgi:hypothetical protein
MNTIEDSVIDAELSKVKLEPRSVETEKTLASQQLAADESGC